MEYLTNHDLIFINHAVTGLVNRYDYFALEACMAGQYKYGDSNDTPGQAATFLERMITRMPFAEGNRRTAFIALLTFLNANGYATLLTEEKAAELFISVVEGHVTPRDAVNALAAPAREPMTAIPLRKLMMFECNHHAEALKLLAIKDGELVR